MIETAAAAITATVGLITVGRVIFGLSRTLTKLDCSVRDLNLTLSSFVSDNESEHEELYGAIEELTENYKKLDKMQTDGFSRERSRKS